VVCVGDGGDVVMAAFAERGRALHLLVRETDGTVRALTSGQRSAAASADRACQNLLVTQSSWGVPPTTSMVSVKNGAVLGVIGDAVDGPAPLLAQAVPVAPRFLDVTAADGTTVLNGLWLPPAPGKTAAAKGSVPVITYAYGGPTGQVVSYRWARLFPLFVHWQQQGFGVFLVDTRGMAGRDRAFTRAHKNAFGQVEVDDLKAAIRQLPTLVPEVNAARVGFFGWSYGGYLAARLALDSDSPVAAAAAVAPVSDWRLYDTAYTERYLGLPGDKGDAATYASSNLLTRAAQLSKPLLLMHGTADDNVLFEHTLRLIQTLQDEGKVFETSIYPGKAHGIAGKTSQLHVHKTLTSFFADKLNGGWDVVGGTAVSSGPIQPLDSLAPEVIRSVVRAHADQIRACYDDELKKTPGIAGKVVMKWVVNNNGTVMKASVGESRLENAAVEDCLARSIKTWVFPKVKGDGFVIVDYPFVFKLVGTTP
jgi:dipeptidyl-peptidase-4